MFKRKTVFVVGAGASFEAGLPIGDQLAKIIEQKLDFSYEGGKLVNGSSEIAQGYDVASSRVGLKRGSFVAEGRQIAASMPLSISIDNYLHTHSHNKAALVLGKLAIANSILEAEQESDFFCQPHDIIDFIDLHARYDGTGRSPSWHNTFFKMATENVKRDALDEVFKNVSVITFNYDRCIEHYVESAFAQFMALSRADARALRERLEIIHPYGKVGELHGDFPTGTAFGEKIYGDQLFEISQQLRTFTEQMDDGDTVARMRLRLAEAETIVFLGFAYGDMNLALMEEQRDLRGIEVLGTAFRISEGNRTVIDAQLRRALSLESRHHLPITLESTTCRELLQDHWRRIIR
jgi:hypothetical protein